VRELKIEQREQREFIDLLSKKQRGGGGEIKGKQRGDLPPELKIEKTKEAIYLPSSQKGTS
jgi:hypothetical protein